MTELRHAAGQALLAFLVLWPFDPTAGLGLALIIWVGAAVRKRGKKSERLPNHLLSFFVGEGQDEGSGLPAPHSPPTLLHQGRGLSRNSPSHEVASLGRQGCNRETDEALPFSSPGQMDDFDLREESRRGCECFE